MASAPEMFGTAVARILRDDFDMRLLIEAGRVVKLGLNFGSSGERDAMVAAFDTHRDWLRLRDSTLLELMATPCKAEDGSSSLDWCVSHSRPVWSCVSLIRDLALKQR